MKITQVKTAFKIADVEFIEGSTRLNFNYLKNLKDKKAILYLKKFLLKTGQITIWKINNESHTL